MAIEEPKKEEPGNKAGSVLREAAPETTGRHLGRVREQFTATTEPFAQYALARGLKEGERLGTLALNDFAGAETAIDLACGPGTFARSFAMRLRRVVGVDFTPAMLQRAERTMAEAGLENAAFVRADVNSLPFADGSFDLATCGYALHHMPKPCSVIREMARVVRSGGRVAVVDLITPDGADLEWHNRIERARDPSHTYSLSLNELCGLFADAGLRVMAAEPDERERDFDEWLRIAGLAPKQSGYVETRRLLEDTAANDVAGFRPRVERATGALRVTQHAVFLVADKA